MKNKMKETIRKERLGKKRYNNEGYLMKIVEYNNAKDIVVEFQDEYKVNVRTTYTNFLLGEIKNQYHKKHKKGDKKIIKQYFPSVYDVGMVGNKYPTCKNGESLKEYKAWNDMLRRCYDENFKKRYPTYQGVYCCEEWLLYEEFYEWLHNQENFDKWFNGKRWAVDKDILVKGNKMYSPEACCLVPNNVNGLFTKRKVGRGKYPVGVTKEGKKFRATCRTTTGKLLDACGYDTPEAAFQDYKKTKESYIRQVAQEEYDKGNITKACYEAMMNYEVEITD